LVFDPRFPNQKLNPLLLIVLSLPGPFTMERKLLLLMMGCLHPLICFCLELFVAPVITNENNLVTNMEEITNEIGQRSLKSE
jgi:hypothetical protein